MNLKIMFSFSIQHNAKKINFNNFFPEITPNYWLKFNENDVYYPAGKIAKK